MPLLTCCSQHLWQKLILQVLQYFRAGKHLIKINVVCKLYSYTPQEAHGKNRFVKWVLVQITELWLVWQWFVVSFLICCGDPQKECPLCVKLTLIKPLCCSAFIFCTAESSSLSASWVNTYYRLAIIKSISSRRHDCSFVVQPTATGITPCDQSGLEMYCQAQIRRESGTLSEFIRFTSSADGGS